MHTVGAVSVSLWMSMVWVLQLRHCHSGLKSHPVQPAQGPLQGSENAHVLREAQGGVGGEWLQVVGTGLSQELFLTDSSQSFLPQSLCSNTSRSSSTSAGQMPPHEPVRSQWVWRGHCGKMKPWRTQGKGSHLSRRRMTGQKESEERVIFLPNHIGWRVGKLGINSRRHFVFKLVFLKLHSLFCALNSDTINHFCHIFQVPNWKSLFGYD